MTEPPAMPPIPQPTIRRLQSPEAATRLPELAAILLDAVAHGASVNFMADCTPDAALGFWQAQLPGLNSGEKHLLVAEAAGQLLGTVMLSLAPQPNAPHRAEVGKMLVLSTARRQGLGRALLAAAETAAQQAGRSLLMLDTETASAGDSLYRSCGWTALGAVPGHSYAPDGRLSAATYFYKALGPHRRPAAVCPA